MKAHNLCHQLTKQVQTSMLHSIGGKNNISSGATRESKNCKAPVLNITNTGKCRKKNYWENTDFRSFQVLGHQTQDLTLYIVYPE
jgi:hypothetical protein